jgi:parallel beta-helix repeat protein
MLLCFLVATSHGFAQTSHYVSSDGNDSWDGNSVSTPWKTISKVNSVPFVPGDAIFFRCGDVFQGQLDVRQSGITLGSYGSGQKPIITGAVQLTGWSRYGLFYVAKASATVKNLFANGVQMTLARYPNSGFLPVETTNGSTTITATAINQPSGYWVGANLRVRSTLFTFETSAVSSSNGPAITLSNAIFFGIKAGWGFYLDNTLAALDSAGEWYCDPATNSVYFWAPVGVDPNTLTIEGSVLDFGVNSSQSNITVQNLEFRCQTQAALRFGGAPSNIQLLSNKIFGAFVNGIQFDGTSTSCTVSNNIIQNAGKFGVTFASASSCTILNNAIKNIGLVPGYGANWTGQMQGINLETGSRNTIGSNTIDSVGYIGIRADGSYNLVENNVITNVLMKLADGGAIYTYADDTYLSAFSTIRNNIINNVVGNMDGAPPGWKVATGIYLDYGSHDMIVEGNTIMRADCYAVYVSIGAYRNAILNNTFYDCASGGGGYFLSINQDTTKNYGCNVIRKNIFYAKTTAENFVKFQDWGPTFQVPGSSDSNYYCAPTANGTPFNTLFKPSGWIGKDYSLVNWKIVTGQDLLSRVPWKDPANPVWAESLLVNATSIQMVVNLGTFAYRDLDSNTVTGNLLLPPYSSKILIKDGFAKNKPPPAGNGSVHRLNYLILGQNYPNPFNPLTDISYHLPIDAKVRLDVFDSIGRMVARLVDENQKAGDYQAAFTNPGLASGVYFYRLSAGEFTETKKMLLIK